MNQRPFPSQIPLTVEQVVSKTHIACFGNRAHLAHCRERAVDALRLWLHAFNPAQNSSGAMTAILALFVGKMMLIVEIEQPLLMGSQQVFPGLRALKMPVG